MRLSTLHENRFNRLLQHVFSSQAIYDILHCELDQRNDFQHGGCWVGADALCRYLRQAGIGAELWAVYGVHPEEDEFGFAEDAPSVAQHVVVKVGSSYFDSDGAHNSEQILRKAQKYEGVKDPELRPWSPADAGEIYHSEDLVNRLVAHLVETLGDPQEWRKYLE